MANQLEITVETPGGIRHGRDHYEEGKPYTVDEVLAGYFIGQGWASSESSVAAAVSTDDVTLDIQNETIGVFSPEVGLNG